MAQALEVENNHFVTTAVKTGSGIHLQWMLTLGWTSDEVQDISTVLISPRGQFIGTKWEHILFMQWRNWTMCWLRGQGHRVLSDGILERGHLTYAVFHPKMQNLTLIMKKHQTQNEFLYSDKGWEDYVFQKCAVMKDKKKKKKSMEMFRWKKAKGTWELDAMSDPRLHTVLEGKCYKRQHWANRLNWIWMREQIKYIATEQQLPKLVTLCYVRGYYF